MITSILEQKSPFFRFSPITVVQNLVVRGSKRRGSWFKAS